MADIVFTEDDLKSERAKGYSKGYSAGRKAASVINTEKQETYNVIVTTLAKMYLDGSWGTKVDGKHVAWKPDECFTHAIKDANRMIREVSIK